METVTVPLLEREAQLGSLTGYADEAERGDGRFVLVAGEAGVGKSALVEQAQRDRPAAQWFWGACDGLFTPRPLGPLFDMASKLGGELLELCRADAPRDELFRALLGQVSTPGAVHVLVVEDIHWADAATVDLLRFLGRRLRGVPVLVIATYRDDGLSPDEPLRVALGDLATQRSTRRIGLAPLSARAVGVLAAESGLEAAALYRLTGGNPFYVTEVVQSGMGEVPPSARDAVLARAARLRAGPRAVLDAAALTGTQAELTLLDTVAGCPPATVDELATSGLVTADGDGLRFRHEIARWAVAEAVPAHRRAPLHASILTFLQSAGCDDDARLAFHAEAAGDAAAVLRHATAAARRAAGLGAHREAAAQDERALRFAAGQDPAAVAGLYDSFGYELGLLDRWQDAVGAREHALTLWRRVGDQLRAGDTLRWLACSLSYLCRNGAGAVAGAEAIALLEPLGPTAELAFAYSSHASLHMVTAANEDAIRLARRAQEIARPLGLTRVLSDALNTEACASHATGGEWAAAIRAALDIALAGGHEEQASRAYTNAHALYNAERRFAEAEPYFTAGLAYCEEHDITTYAAFLRSERTSMLERTGCWDEAAALSQELLERGGPSPTIRLSPLNQLGAIRARRGAPGAQDYLDKALRYADAGGEPQNIVPVRLNRAELCWLQGRAAEAVREAELADDVAAGADAWERGAVAVWLRRTGSGRPPRGPLAAPYQAEIDGHPAEAARLWTGLGCRYETGLALLGAVGEEPLRTALRIFTDLGAAATARLTRHRMRDLGVRSIPAGPRAATREHPLGLTRREQEVLGLICAGHTNAEIAGQLFISAKTVDHHVSAVLAKLGAPTRNAAAAQAAQVGLVPAAD
ncbi:MAG TPA: AAA family ATPase [Streptosporangiaceae bacterium]|nr:AAA family ATPase [Streptosporangiaceae bacterium]